MTTHVLPNLQPISTPGQRILPSGAVFPYVASPAPDDSNTLRDWIQAASTWQEKLEKLLDDHGALILRGLPITTADEFSQFLHSFGWTPHVDVGNMAKRKVLAPNVARANEGPPDLYIGSHNEFGLSNIFPSHICFWAGIVPEQGGETALASGHVLYEQMRLLAPEFIDALTEKGVTYTIYHPTNNIPNTAWGNGILNAWGSQVTPKDDDGTVKRKVEAEIKRISPESTCEWIEEGEYKGGLYSKQRVPAIRKQPNTNLPVLFCNLVSVYLGAVKLGTVDPPHHTETGFYKPPPQYGDDTPIPMEYLDLLLSLVEQTRTMTRWESNDVMIINSVPGSCFTISSPPSRRLTIEGVSEVWVNRDGDPRNCNATLKMSADAPIHRLLPELLSRVLVYAVKSFEEREAEVKEKTGAISGFKSRRTRRRRGYVKPGLEPSQISAVCSHWRDVSLSTAELWSSWSVVVKNGHYYDDRILELFQLHLERSKGFPLSICIAMGIVFGHGRFNFEWEGPINPNTRDIRHDILRIVFAQSERICVLSFRWRQLESEVFAAPFFKMIGSQLQNLEHLLLHPTQPWNAATLYNTLSNCSRLRSLQLSELVLSGLRTFEDPSFAFSLTQITYLCIGFTSAEACVGLLKLCPNVIDLYVTIAHPDLPRQLGWTVEEIYLPQLQSMTVALGPGEPSYLIDGSILHDAITAPALTSYTLDGEAKFSVPHRRAKLELFSPLVNMMHRSACRLRTLHIKCLPIVYEDLEPLLDTLPIEDLTELSLHEGKDSLGSKKFRRSGSVPAPVLPHLLADASDSDLPECYVMLPNDAISVEFLQRRFPPRLKALSLYIRTPWTEGKARAFVSLLESSPGIKSAYLEVDNKVLSLAGLDRLREMQNAGLAVRVVQRGKDGLKTLLGYEL
uniref:TauD/TfdA-like domain-containing protein n=1 Tax=Moniliophthora roreri TaxID=221103 RepID=A0A0W0FBM3_MONRR